MEATPPPVGYLTETLRKAEGHVRKARQGHIRMVLVVLLASALSALMTTLPAALNHPVVGTWRVTCGIAAVLSAIAAVTTGLQAQFNHADRIAEATECLGKLRALDVQYQLGAAPDADLTRQLSKIIAKYPQYT